MIKYSQLKLGLLVRDRWFSEWGNGRVTKLLKTRVEITFTCKGTITYDIPHLQFLEVVL